MTLFDHLEDPDGLELSLRRVATGARLVGLVWAGILGAVVLGRTNQGTGWIETTLGLIAVWGVASTVLAARAPELVTSRGAIGIDVLVSLVAFEASEMAGDAGRFYGGLPLVVVAIAAIRGRRATALVAAILLAGRTVVTASGEYFETLGQVLLYAGSALLLGWAIEVMRRANAEMRRAQEGLAQAEADRARAEERSAMSRHLHDSVLQTLALIQRSTGDPAAVTSLARRQERELREWLFGSGRPVEGSFAEALRSEAADIEERYRVVMDLVVVGDGPVADGRRALLDAAKEAMVNAAKHSGCDSVAVFAEVGEGSTRVFVRDRGPGFDPETVSADRRGVRDSIRGRLGEVGGRAEVRTVRGTEWSLEVDDG